MVNIVPLTRSHLDNMGTPTPPHTIRGMAIVEGGKTLAFGGIYVAGDRYVMAAEVTEEMHDQLRRGRHVREFMRCARAVLAMAKAGIPVYSLADPEKYGSASVLEHLGFHHVNEDLWATSA